MSDSIKSDTRDTSGHVTPGKVSKGRVAAAGPHHPPAALGALDGIFPVVEQRRLARRGSLGDHRRRRCGATFQSCIRLRQTGPDLRRQHADLLLLVDRQELLAHPPKMQSTIDFAARMSGSFVIPLGSKRMCANFET